MDDFFGKYFWRPLIPEEPCRKFLVCISGKTLDADKMFIEQLKNVMKINLQEVSKVDECDFILVFCPVASRAGTDIEATMKKLHRISDTKPAVLVVLHHTFDVHSIVPETWRSVTRKNLIAIECLFHEDLGFHKCEKNNESLSKITTFINSLEKPQLNVRKQEQGGPDIEPEKTNTKVKNINKEQQSENARHQLLKTNYTKNKYPFLENMEEQLAKKIHLVKDMQEDVVTEKEQLSDLKEYLDKNEKTLAEKDAEIMDLHKNFQKNIQEKERLERNVEEKKINIQENLKKFQNYVENNEKTLAQKDAELKKTNEKLHKSTEVLKEKSTELEKKHKLLNETETQLRNTNKKLETSENKTRTLEQELGTQRDREKR
ncbi:ring-infected erythrocyte surface antigen-like [Silurus meridionalis]|uniref:ring-infected erythrocyte surface antigen-like n=1 Tax=Silurus meridionalis TaxID=175797 RepID=UPI001EEACF9B|nr:ring-infected erythrocyte surface antigen-like [Silurus meridionalis]